MFFTNFLLNFNAYKKCYLMLDIKNTKGVTSRTFEHTHIYSSFIHNGFPFTSWNEFFFFSTSSISRHLFMGKHHSFLHFFMWIAFWSNDFALWCENIMKSLQKHAGYVSCVMLPYWWNFLLPQSNLRENPLGNDIQFSLIFTKHTRILLERHMQKFTQKIQCFKSNFLYR